MRCIRPIKASQNDSGDIVYNIKKASRGLVPFQFECRKCLPCRLNLAREKAVRAVHEAKMHEGNIFLTLTYNEANLESPRLIYGHFQDFMKKLRHTTPEKISCMVTGEYGELNKRPHWHAIIFNYYPKDAKHKYSTDNEERVYTSELIDELWNKGKTEFGSVTMDSAGYVARYAAKKLVHGKDQEHDFHPIHKTSSRYAIGKSWIEKYHQHTFENGFVVLPDGGISKIPRYYVDWAKKYKPKLWKHYVTEVRPNIILNAEKKARKEEIEHLTNIWSRGPFKPRTETRSEVKLSILKRKFEQLQENLKL